MIGYLLAYARLTNTRSLALLADPHGVAYEILFSFHSPEEKSRFPGLVRSNQDLGDDYIENDLMIPPLEEIQEASTRCCFASARNGPCCVSRKYLLYERFSKLNGTTTQVFELNCTTRTCRS